MISLDVMLKKEEKVINLTVCVINEHERITDEQTVIDSFIIYIRKINYFNNLRHLFNCFSSFENVLVWK